MKDLAVLIPTYNGGERVRRSVESCALSGLEPWRYSLIVVDNCSTDGSVDMLPRYDTNGVPVKIYRNKRNLGRVANWNRALEIAEDGGFRFATFLFAGDKWVQAPGMHRSSIDQLLAAMKRTEAVLGMAPLRITQEETKSARTGARISIPGESATISSQRLLEHSIRTGRLPFAPIQANIYRLFADRPLRFSEDERDALNTDLEATVLWLQHHPGEVALVSSPYLIWSGHASRFLSRQDPWFVLLETRRTLERASEMSGIEVDWKSANAVSMLTAMRELMPSASLLEKLRFFLRVARYLRSCRGGLDLRYLLSFTRNKLFRKQSYLSVPEALDEGGGASTGGKLSSVPTR